MFADISTRLTEIVAQKRLKGKLEQDLIAVEEEYHDQSARLQSLNIQLEKEQVDVDKLEGTSLTALFYTVLGSREQQLEKERQELLSAQLQFQQTKRQVAYLERERDRLVRQLEGLSEVDATYDSLLAEKEQLLRQSNQPVAGELVSISERMANLKAELREISEAVRAGKDALAGLDQVIKALESAENWGTWDLLGGGLVSTAIKHSRIDEARSNVEVVQTQLSRFNRELADVQKSVDLHIDISGFESFADYFIDGLIIDWIVQSKIAGSLERSRQAKEGVAETLGSLKKLEKNAQGNLHGLQEKRSQLIENA